MSERRFKKYIKRQLLNERFTINRLQNQGVAFDEFMSNLTNYSSDTDRTEMLNMLVKFIVDMDHPESYFTDLINDLADKFQRDGDGNHFTGTMSENKKPLKETIVKFDDFSFEIHEDFSSTPTFIIPNVEFETDSEGYAIANNENSLKLRGFSDEIKAMYTLFGPESGVKDQNGLYLSIDDIINYL